MQAIRVFFWKHIFSFKYDVPDTFHVSFKLKTWNKQFLLNHLLNFSIRDTSNSLTIDNIVICVGSYQLFYKWNIDFDDLKGFSLWRIKNYWRNFLFSYFVCQKWQNSVILGCDWAQDNDNDKTWCIFYILFSIR